MAGGFAAVYAVVMRDHHVRTRVFGPLNERGRGARSKVIVAVHKLDVFALCGRDARVARGGNARVFLVDDMDTGVDAFVHVADGAGSVLAAVVDEEYLDVSVGLFADALDAARKVRRRVVHGDDDGYERLFQGCLLCCFGVDVRKRKRYLHHGLVQRGGARPQLVVNAVLCQQLFVGALFLDAVLAQHKNAVRVLDGRQAVGDGEGGAPLGAPGSGPPGVRFHCPARWWPRPE